ncbi:MAG: ATP-binding protein [Candidatus Aminicenantes bacterium]|jgi:predicted AAA+ superfamily ATPase
MEKIRDVLLMQKRELEEFSQKNYVPRSVQLKELTKDIIKVIIGPRRAGKSFFAIHELKKIVNLGYANFDDESLVGITNYNDIIEIINSLYQNPKLLFLDEIQNLPKWELFVNRLQRQGYNLVITGSNSNLLSSELATHLTGRHISTIVFPFSFKEYLNYFGNKEEFTTGELKTKLHDYLHNGGYPEPLVKELDYNDYLRTLHDAILFKDIVKRHHIRSIKPMADLSRFLISNSSIFVSYRNLARLTDLKSVGTIVKYLGHFQEAFLFFELGAFSIKYKQQVKSPKKIYTIDNGFIFSKGFRFTGNIGVLYENLVAVELKKMELEGKLEFYYYKNPQGYEVDFVVKKGNEITDLIQVSYRVDNEKTKTREIRSLLHGCKDLKCDHLIVITGDYEDEESVEWFGLKGKVCFIPLWKWLLDPDFS